MGSDESRRQISSEIMKQLTMVEACPCILLPLPTTAALAAAVAAPTPLLTRAQLRFHMSTLPSLV